MHLFKESRIQITVSVFKLKKIRLKTRTADLFSVLKTILLRRLNKIKSRLEIRANGYKLTEIKEQLLLKQLLDINKRGFLIWPEFLHKVAQILLDNYL